MSLPKVKEETQKLVGRWMQINPWESKIRQQLIIDNPYLLEIIDEMSDSFVGLPTEGQQTAFYNALLLIYKLLDAQAKHDNLPPFRAGDV